MGGQSSERETIILPYRLSQRDYADIIAGLGQVAALFGLVLDGSNAIGRSASLLAALKPWWIETVDLSHWPGTTAADPVPVGHFRAEAGALEILVGMTSGFSDWSHDAGLPEDPHFLRKDLSLVLGSTTCEAAAWLEVSPAERSLLQGCMSPTFRLGVFDPLDDFDRWFAVYRADLEFDGEVVGPVSSSIERLVSVRTGPEMNSVRVDSRGQGEVTTRRNGIDFVEAFEVSDSDDLATLLLKFQEIVTQASLRN